jgi:MFS superfamily sulfate permease-like transporter
MAVGVTSALSIMVAGTPGGLALSDAEDYLAAAGFVAIMAGVIAILAGVFRLGFVVNFISESVLVGFSAGAALFIASSQIAKLFGIEGADGNFFERIGNVLSNLGETNGWTPALGLACLVALLVLEKTLPKLPAALIVFAVAIGLLWVSGLEDRGVAITGEIPQGLPVPVLPLVDISLVPALTSLALGCFLLSYVEGIGVARTFASRYKYQIDANQENSWRAVR